MSDDLVPIGDFARKARMTVRALRHYQDLGVFLPARVDPRTGYRSYRLSQLEDLLTVQLLRELDVPLDDIRAHREGRLPLPTLLTAERERLERRAARASRGIAVIDQLAKAGSLPEAEAQVVVMDRTLALSLTHEVQGDTLLAEATELVTRLLQVADTQGLDTSVPVLGEYPATLDGTIRIRLHLPVDRHDPFDGRDAEDGGPGAQAGHEVPKAPTLPPGTPPDVRWRTLPGGHFGRVVHTGPLESLPLAYHRIVSWLHRTGHPATGPFLERYVDDPFTTDPTTLRTQVLHPVPPPE